MNKIADLDSNIAIIKAQLDEQNKMLQKMITNTSIDGVKETLHVISGEYDMSLNDLIEVKSLLNAFKSAKKTIWKTLVKLVTTAVIIVFISGLMLKAKIF